VFILHLVPLPGTDGIRALRALLKVSLRKYGLKVTSAIESSETVPAC
jgi:hypothetical protein